MCIIIDVYHKTYDVDKLTMSRIVALFERCGYKCAFKCFSHKYKKCRDPERLMRKCILHHRLSYASWKAVMKPYLGDCDYDSDDGYDSDDDDYKPRPPTRDSTAYILPFLFVIIIILLLIIAFR